MKNVTGYDLVKLMAGSYGTLGVMSEVAFKVLPRLGGASLLVRGADGLAALEAMTRAVTSPFEVSGAAAVPDEGVYLRVEGLEGSVKYRLGRLTELLSDLGTVEVIDDPDASSALWLRLRDVTDFAKGSSAVWRVSMKPSDLVGRLLPVLGRDLDMRLDWAGGLGWLRLCDDAEEPQIMTMHGNIQAAVAANGGGHATLFKATPAVLAEVNVFQPEAPGVAALSRGLRAKFDPRGILNPGLMGG